MIIAQRGQKILEIDLKNYSVSLWIVFFLSLYDWTLVWMHYKVQTHATYGFRKQYAGRDNRSQKQSIRLMLLFTVAQVKYRTRLQTGYT